MSSLVLYSAKNVDILRKKCSVCVPNTAISGVELIGAAFDRVLGNE